MSAIGRRMNDLKSLMYVRNGPGAAILPPTVTKIHLEFAHKWDGGHYGPRKFWQKNLPRLKYHNPAVPMIVNRTKDQTAAATLSIYMKTTTSSSSSSSSSAAATTTTPTTTTTPSPPSPEAAEAAPDAATSEATTAAPGKPVAVADPWLNIASSTQGLSRAPPPSDGETVVTINMKFVSSDDILRQFVAKTGARELEPSEEDRAEMTRLEELEKQAEADRAVQKAFRDKIKAEKKMLERARQEANALKGD
ncbi:hypothetical protein M406DRAFT_68691 [Cryphonectria parasitica EP155]|uniref:Ribosomal protein/NADH dehydrogenase domain-containing protein n=1 Tax=Cryphonectria parasitica (strain ATCC 38755 / EP155) TaxID=660469 RepID=A0A9P5CPD0_CRYP1|nr:uncharacterized protein M406DRAFT_68691 [Cryphonectria parasitica EP155]KAF3766339.1 hypothetical protein M406DRAFT_68691 [Cryphonectria parasitica EP155]